MTGTTNNPSRTAFDEQDAEFIDGFRRPVTLGNRVRDTNPMILLAIVVLLAVTVVALPEIIGPAAMCVACGLFAAVAGVGRVFTTAYLKLCLVVGVLLFAVRAVFAVDREAALWAWGPFAVSAAGIGVAADFALLVMAMCGLITLLFTLVPIRYLMLALERVGMSPKASYVMLASFQAITELGAHTRTVLEAQKARGIETDGSLWRRARAFFPVLTPVFLSAMSATEERALALDARAFHAPVRHTHLAFLPRTSATQWAMLVGTVVLTALAITGKVLLWH